MAILLPIAFFVLLVGVQYALIGQAAIAVSQLSYNVARYASINPTAALKDLNAYWPQVAPASINDATKLRVSLLTPCGTPSFGSSVTIDVQYDVTGKIFLPNPFFGALFPRQVTASQSAFCEAGPVP